MNATRLLGLSVAAAALAAVADLGASPAFADPNPTSSSAPSDSAYELSVDLAGTGVVIDYSLDDNGTVTNAATAAAGGDAATSHEINLGLSDSAVTVELGDGSASVEDVQTQAPEASDSAEPDASGQGQDQNAQDNGQTEQQSGDAQSGTDSTDGAESQAPHESSATSERTGSNDAAPSSTETAPEPASTESSAPESGDQTGSASAGETSGDQTSPASGN